MLPGVGRNTALDRGEAGDERAEGNAASAKVVVQVAAEQERWQDVLSAAQAWKQRAPAESLLADVAAARAGGLGAGGRRWSG